tara:strand:+ start:1939 stop:2076 length:138 start_codon:yes stop_codon:yes gene_type:complete
MIVCQNGTYKIELVEFLTEAVANICQNGTYKIELVEFLTEAVANT